MSLVTIYKFNVYSTDTDDYNLNCDARMQAQWHTIHGLSLIMIAQAGLLDQENSMQGLGFGKFKNSLRCC